LYLKPLVVILDGLNGMALNMVQMQMILDFNQGDNLDVKAHRKWPVWKKSKIWYRTNLMVFILKHCLKKLVI